MTGQRVGYIRVSSTNQNPERQLDDAALDRVCTDQVLATDATRPPLQDMLKFVRDGDTIVVRSLDRLARNLEDLRQIVQSQTARWVRVEFVKEGLSFIGEDSPIKHLMLNVMRFFAEFDRMRRRRYQNPGVGSDEVTRIPPCR